MTSDADLVRASTRIYNHTILSFYDVFVVDFSSTFVWRSPRSMIINFYNQHVSGYHLDLGVGTGYFLDKCTFPSMHPTVALADISPQTLAKTAKRIKRYRPATYLVNAREPLQPSIPTTFDSIGMNYVWHCIPGSIEEKAAVFAHLKPLLNPGGVLFGTTVLGPDPHVQHTLLARLFMAVYNATHVFNNQHDTCATLERALAQHFKEYRMHVLGSTAFFVAR